MIINLGAVSIKFSPPFLVYLDYFGTQPMIITLGDYSNLQKVGMTSEK